MKIAIATNDRKSVTGHLGRCRAFMVFEIEGEKIVHNEVRENVFTSHRLGEQQHHHHGEGEGNCHTRLANGLKDCTYLISSGGGWRVVEDLKKHNITTLFTNEELIDNAVAKFMRGQLKDEVDLVCRSHE